ncbi:hypothetical protein NEFER03_1772 [Nematocida sp. LUAm3]|nr:hypothetical protein NEFER03_1772 [Nematocida sp. LUAm3]KAI5173921.1 hypothetical protein NEFER02_0388 [Nematocida sp. LUAm2]KAI5177334.1 hypothetical protein NEFER01_0609 [Nematocida sp. LUAm1]
MDKGGKEEGKKEEEGEWVSKYLFNICRILRRVPLPFDIKFFLYIAIECICALLFTRRYSKRWGAGSSREVDRGSVDGDGSEEKKIAVIMDGTSQRGKELVRKLIINRYFVIHPDSCESEDRTKKTIKATLDREESAEAFIKKVTIQIRKIDLLVINQQKFSASLKRPVLVKGMEKKIVPSIKKQGFISKNRSYREPDRMLLEKDPNVRKNYMLGFLFIRGLASALKNGDGKVLIASSRVYGLVESHFKWPMLPSFFFSFCYSQMCMVLLGIGAQARYGYLDIRIVSSDLFFSDVFSSSIFQGKAYKYVSVPPEAHVSSLLHAANLPKEKSLVIYTDFIFRSLFDGNIDGYDRANDLWEQAEIIS